MRVDPNYVINLAAAVGQSSGVEAALTNQLTSGLRVSSLQEDPIAVAQGSLLSSAIAKGDSYVGVASGETSLLQVSDTALGEVVKQLTSALTLAVQGNDGTLTPSNIAIITNQLKGIRDQVLSLANTSYQGQYVFSGSQGAVKPFTLNTVPAPATTTYNGDTNLQYLETPSGQKIQVNLPGSSIFGGGSGAFAALNQLIADFSSGAPSPTITADASALTTSLQQVSDQRSILGSSLNRIESTSVYTQTQSAQMHVQQSTLVASDPAMVATQLSAAETQHRALLSVIAAVQKTNLFDYIK